MLSEAEAKIVCGNLLGYVEADDAIVRLSSTSSSHLRFASNTITTTGRSEDTSAEVTVWNERRRGSATTNAMDDNSLRAAVEQAEQIARVSPVDPEYLPTLDAQKYRSVNGYVGATANIPPARRASEIAAVIESCDRAKVLGYGFHEASGKAVAHATKHGNFLYEQSSDVGFSLTVRTTDGLGSGFFQRSHFDVGKLDLGRIGREAIRKAVESHNPRSLEPGVYCVILEPQATGDLLGYFSYSFDARQADEGRSAFSAPGGKTRLREKVFDERISLYSDPWHPEVPASAAADDLIPAEKTFLIREGLVETLVYSRFWASEKGKAPTPGPVNSILEGSGETTTIEEMIRATQRGLLVSRFWYIRPVNPRTAAHTGLTRDGLWYIEDGEIRYPVRNFRFNQSILDMLAPGNIERVGRPERVWRAAAMPALQLKEFHFTSESDAV
jgi:predicted Zn-dependent protease